jgi:hypothetical protein
MYKINFLMVKNEDFEFFDKGAAKHITLPHHKGRIFIVGDIHGCYDELCDLLEKYRQIDDILIFAGDLVPFFLVVSRVLCIVPSSSLT